jgi:hypothetical protein
MSRLAMQDFRWEDEFAPPATKRSSMREVSSPTDPEWAAEFAPATGAPAAAQSELQWPSSSAPPLQPYFVRAFLEDQERLAQERQMVTPLQAPRRRQATPARLVRVVIPPRG